MSLTVSANRSESGDTTATSISVPTHCPRPSPTTKSDNTRNDTVSQLSYNTFTVSPAFQPAGLTAVSILTVPFATPEHPVATAAHMHIATHCTIPFICFRAWLLLFIFGSLRRTAFLPVTTVAAITASALTIATLLHLLAILATFARFS